MSMKASKYKKKELMISISISIPKCHKKVIINVGNYFKVYVSEHTKLKLALCSPPSEYLIIL